MNAKLHLFFVALCSTVFSAGAQNPFKKEAQGMITSQKLASFQLKSSDAELFTLDVNRFKETLLSAPLRGAKSRRLPAVVALPAVRGMQRFKIYEAPVFSPSLAAKYPNIKSYTGVGITNPRMSLRMSVSPQGVQTMISSPGNPTVFMQPIAKGTNQYLVYQRSDNTDSKTSFVCTTPAASTSATAKRLTSLDEGGANTQTLQKFRIAISTTSEYTAYHDDGDPANGDAIADALAAINATLSRVNQVFETDVAVTFELVDAPQLIYNDAAKDPYSGRGGNLLDIWNNEVQKNLTTVIGNEAYDVGHLFTTSGGGNAGGIGTVCVAPTTLEPLGKGSAFSGPQPNGQPPEGDVFDIGFVAHEIGHQMGATHTFAFSPTDFNVGSEPGVGTTIMSYGGLPGLDAVQDHSDPYFHYHSIREILSTLSGKNCQTRILITDNNPPVADAGPDYSIPLGTPYVLRGHATDADDTDQLTYCWEQIDAGTVVTYSNFGPTLSKGTMNRSYPPSISPDRYIPKLSSVAVGAITHTEPSTPDAWETVSTVPRELNWALTVRDRALDNPKDAQTSFDRMKIDVIDTDPFTVDNPSAPWLREQKQTITWHVGDTDKAPINSKTVNIKLSTDGGATFPITLVSETPNDGAYEYLVPSTIANTEEARLLVEAADNIFYAISDRNFPLSTEPSFFLFEDSVVPVSCRSTSTVASFRYVPVNGFSGNTSFEIKGLPEGAIARFSPQTLSQEALLEVTISNIPNNITVGNYPLILEATSGTITKRMPFELPVFSRLCESSGINYEAFKTQITEVNFNSIVNKSGEKLAGYEDKTTISTTVKRGKSYPLTVKVDTDGDFKVATRAWIDWNRNCQLEENERYELGTNVDVSNVASSNSPLAITVPEDAVLGKTTMRITTSFQNNRRSDVDLPTPCGIFDGETEDYTIEIIDSTLSSANTNACELAKLVVSPNPNNGIFYADFKTDNPAFITATLFDLQGRLVYQKALDFASHSHQKIAMRHVVSGVYILKLSRGLSVSIRKIVVR